MRKPQVIYQPARKYGNARLRNKDGDFDSGLEYCRWIFLKDEEKAGRISGLRRQVPFELVPAQRDGGPKGRLLERPVTYVADFVYTRTADGARVVEDAKGVRTAAYVIKRKLMLRVHGVRIREVEGAGEKI